MTTTMYFNSGYSTVYLNHPGENDATVPFKGRTWLAVTDAMEAINASWDEAVDPFFNGQFIAFPAADVVDPKDIPVWHPAPECDTGDRAPEPDAGTDPPSAPFAPADILAEKIGWTGDDDEPIKFTLTDDGIDALAALLVGPDSNEDEDEDDLVDDDYRRQVAFDAAAAALNVIDSFLGEEISDHWTGEELRLMSDLESTLLQLVGVER